MSAKKKDYLAVRQDQSLKQLALMIAMGAGVDSIRSKWEDFVIGTASSGVSFDVNAAVQQVIRESYNEATGDLRFYAERVKYYNECKKVVRDYMQQLREMQEKEEQELKTLDDLTQNMAIELQNKTDKFQELVQLISQVQKMLDDAARAILDDLDKKSKAKGSLRIMKNKHDTVKNAIHNVR